MQRIAIGKIKPNPDNPRLIRDEKFRQLVKSIKEFPEMLELRPIIVNKDMMVLGGNMRLKACQEAGLKEVPVIVADQLSATQQREFIIKDNLGYGEWNWELIANEWDAELIKEWGLDIPGIVEEKEQDDLSDSIKTEYKIEVICKDEQTQEKAYNFLLSKGYECRLLTL